MNIPHHPRKAFFQHSVHHLYFGDRRVRKGLLKASLAYGGALLMGFDAAASLLGPSLFPHLFHACEAEIACGGKFGAAAAGFAVFFDGLIRAALVEAAAFEADHQGAGA